MREKEKSRQDELEQDIEETIGRDDDPAFEYYGRNRSGDRGNAAELRRRRARVMEERRLREQERQDIERWSRTNHEIRFTALILSALFLSLIGYLGYFLTNGSDQYRSSSYNQNRQALLAERYSRGDIVAADGTLLATTKFSEDGRESRYYPEGELYAHAVGYTINGITGMEASASSYMLDSHRNVLLQVIGELRGEKTVGDTVRSTLEPRLQKVANEALGDHKGAVVVMEPATGKVLAMVSKPDFDPNRLEKNFDDLDEGTLVNRATQGLYAPGSTFKILTVLEYIRENPNRWSSFTYDCDGIMEADTYTIQCYGQTAHSREDLKSAFASSCNGAFATMGRSLNFRKFHALCESFGFNKPINGSVGMNQSSFVLTNGNSLWDVLQTSIGQGETQITPMLNCMIAAGVANGGVMMKPTLAGAVLNREGDVIRLIPPAVYDTVMSPKEAEILKDMMREVCAGGTGTAAQGSGYTAYGKTGSAETAKEADTNAWFVGWAEKDNSERKLAVSIIVEEGGSGGSAAAPIAKRIFDSAFGN